VYTYFDIWSYDLLHTCMLFQHKLACLGRIPTDGPSVCCARVHPQVVGSHMKYVCTYANSCLFSGTDFRFYNQYHPIYCSHGGEDIQRNVITDVKILIQSLIIVKGQHLL